MKQINININMCLCAMDELPEHEQQLVEAAKNATQNSYAKYSNFNVGAAIRLSDGSIIIGANQENASFPLGLCAERTAIFAAQAQHPELKIETLAIAARNANGFMKAPISPCGACRQVILEIEDRYRQPVRILLYGTEGVLCIDSVKDLMPLAFIDENMH